MMNRVLYLLSILILFLLPVKSEVVGVIIDPQSKEILPGDSTSFNVTVLANNGTYIQIQCIPPNDQIVCNSQYPLYYYFNDSTVYQTTFTVSTSKDILPGNYSIIINVSEPNNTVIQTFNLIVLERIAPAQITSISVNPSSITTDAQVTVKYIVNVTYNTSRGYSVVRCTAPNNVICKPVELECYSGYNTYCVVSFNVTATVPGTYKLYFSANNEYSSLTKEAYLIAKQYAMQAPPLSSSESPSTSSVQTNTYAMQTSTMSQQQSILEYLKNPSTLLLALAISAIITGIILIILKKRG